MYLPNVYPLPCKNLASYTGENLSLHFEVEGKSDLQVLSTIKDMVTNDMECQVLWKKSLVLALTFRMQDSENLFHTCLIHN